MYTPKNYRQLCEQTEKIVQFYINNPGGYKNAVEKKRKREAYFYNLGYVLEVDGIWYIQDDINNDRTPLNASISHLKTKK